MLQRIAVPRVMRTCGKSKIEPAELERKDNDQPQGNRPCGYRSSCPTTRTQWALPALKINSPRLVIQGLSPPIAEVNLQDSFFGVKRLLRKKVDGLSLPGLGYNRERQKRTRKGNPIWVTSGKESRDAVGFQ